MPSVGDVLEAPVDFGNETCMHTKIRVVSVTKTTVKAKYLEPSWSMMSLPAATYHSCREDETLALIATQLALPVAALLDANPNIGANDRRDTAIVVPNVYVTRENETLTTIAAKLHCKCKHLRDKNAGLFLRKGVPINASAHLMKDTWVLLPRPDETLKIVSSIEFRV